ncbi:unnamed protein product, partial [Trichobilharzia szidati]
MCDDRGDDDHHLVGIEHVRISNYGLFSHCCFRDAGRVLIADNTSITLMFV